MNGWVDAQLFTELDAQLGAHAAHTCTHSHFNFHSDGRRERVQPASAYVDSSPAIKVVTVWVSSKSAPLPVISDFESCRRQTEISNGRPAYCSATDAWARADDAR